MTAAIQVTGYVVGFGDCVLLRLPDGGLTRHILIDFGRAPNDAASLARFPAIARDIEKQTNGHLDLLVVTHEHLDHLEGFYREREVFNRMQVDRVWMGLPSQPSYYQTYPRARLQKRLQAGLQGFLDSAGRAGMSLHPGFRALIENNLSNVDRMDYLRKLGKKPVAYLARGKPVPKAFDNIQIKVLAPEPDVSVYYSVDARERALSSALEGEQPGRTTVAAGERDWNFSGIARASSSDFGGISPSDFNRLRTAIREDGVNAARFIDKAGNNTSLCLMVEVQGKRLLLPGDAELESWGVIARKCAAELKPVDFLKVSHHGSHNGTPLDLLDRLLPVKRKDRAQVLVSTKRNVYGTKNPVPDATLLDDLRRRCHRLVTTDGQTGTSVRFEL